MKQGPYIPREGSLPDRVIQHLRAQGGTVDAGQISALLGVDAKNVGSNMALAVKHGLLVREGQSYTLGDGIPVRKTLKTVAQEFHRQHHAVGNDAWGGAAKPAFPGAPPRAGDAPPVPAATPPAALHACTEAVKVLNPPAIRQALASHALGKSTTQPASLRQVGGTHYKQMPVQPWDVVDGWPLDQRIGYYRGNALKYLMRMGSKDQDAQEIGKGRHYVEKLLEVLQEQDLRVTAS